MQEMLPAKLQILGNYGTIATIFHIDIYGFCHPITLHKCLCRYSEPHRITAKYRLRGPRSLIKELKCKLRVWVDYIDIMQT